MQSRLSVELIKDPRALKSELGQKTLNGNAITNAEYPYRHYIVHKDITERGWKAIEHASELDPKDYKELMLVKGMGRFNTQVTRICLKPYLWKGAGI